MQTVLEEDYTRKQELVAALKELQDFGLRASDNLDQKAWNILSVSSATFGIVTAIQISLITDKTPSTFWLGLIVVLIFYLLQVRHVLEAIKPVEWSIVPGAEPYLSFENLIKKYVEDDNVKISNHEYYNQLIADYAGNIDVKDRKTLILGSIQQIQEQNRLKSDHIKSAAQYLGYIIAGQILLSFIAASGR